MFDNHRGLVEMWNFQIVFRTKLRYVYVYRNIDRQSAFQSLNGTSDRSITYWWNFALERLKAWNNMYQIALLFSSVSCTREIANSSNNLYEGEIYFGSRIFRCLVPIKSCSHSEKMVEHAMLICPLISVLDDWEVTHVTRNG